MDVRVPQNVRERHPSSGKLSSVPDPLHGRGVTGNPAGRFERFAVVDDPVDPDDDRPARPTELFRDTSKTVLTTNDSPDVPMDVTVNPYRGCEHGCVYCYARPYHEYLGLSAGVDFESRIFVKENAPALLRAELMRRSWTPQIIGLSGVTDPYQPVERRLRLTRACLEVLAEFRNPVAIITKSHLVTRDADLLHDLARVDAAQVMVSITTLDDGLARAMEPRAARPDLRLDALRVLSDAGIPTGVMVAPIVPGLTDHEVPAILRAAAAAGARTAGYTMLRLPHGVKDLFADWLDRHAPDRKARVLGRVRDVRGGRLNVSAFGTRMKGEGPVADAIRQMFTLHRRRAGLTRPIHLSTAAFRRPGAQAGLFDDEPA
jgi:DNA repair photolyase